MKINGVNVCGNPGEIKSLDLECDNQAAVFTSFGGKSAVSLNT